MIFGASVRCVGVEGVRARGYGVTRIKCVERGEMAE
jgi:hypothetical protein